MIFCRFSDGYSENYGLVEGHSIQPISGDIFSAWQAEGDPVAFNEVTLLAPVLPSKIVGVGLNYAAHAQELGFKMNDSPTLFLKPSTTVIAQQQKIIIPKMSKQVEHEAELAIVIGKTAKNVSVQDANQYIFGYTCMNDVTARDLQKLDGQWTRAKSFDTFSPLGPWIVTDLDPSNLQIEFYLNGHLRQNANTSDMIFSVPSVLSFISQVMTLYPGDVITTGTPPGVSAMKQSDVADVRIEGIGILRNFVDEE